MTEQEKQYDFSDGYIKLYRRFKENVFYKNSEAVHLWLHLLFSASFEDNIFYYKNTKIERKKGQLITGRKKLSQETGIGESTIFRLLKLFESEHQIEQQKTNKYTIITIISYDKYNGNEQQNEQQMNNKRTTNEQQMNTSKELKELKELKKDILRFKKPTLEEVKKYCLERGNNIDAERFIDSNEAKGWMIGKNKMKDWKAAIRTWEKNQAKWNNEQNQEEKSPYRMA